MWRKIAAVISAFVLAGLLAAAVWQLWPRWVLFATPVVGLDVIQASIERGDFSGALRFAQKRAAANPGEATAHLFLARALYGRNRIDEAMDELGTALGSARNEADRELGSAVEAEVLDLTATIHLEITKEYRKAAAALQRVIALEPDNWGAHYRLGTAYAYSGLSQSAFKEFDAVIKGAPGSEMARYAENAIQYVRERRDPRQSKYPVA